MKVKKQYGVIPYIKSKKNGHKIVLITSKTNGYWIFPKGHLIKKKNEAQSAAQEAYEEAGIEGKIKEDFSYKVTFKHLEQEHELTFFAMKVEKVFDTWPEMKDRKRKIVSVNKAEELLNLPDLQKCLTEWKQDFQ